MENKSKQNSDKKNSFSHALVNREDFSFQRNSVKPEYVTEGRLFEHRRDFARWRHHGLNLTIDQITKKIPGHHQFNNDSKIIKLHRFIIYIHDLEEVVGSLCTELQLPASVTDSFMTVPSDKSEESQNAWNDQIAVMHKDLTGHKIHVKSVVANEKYEEEIPVSVSTPKRPNAHGITDKSVESLDIERIQSDHMMTESADKLRNSLDNPSAFVEDVSEPSEPASMKYAKEELCCKAQTSFLKILHMNERSNPLRRSRILREIPMNVKSLNNPVAKFPVQLVKIISKENAGSKLLVDFHSCEDSENMKFKHVKCPNTIMSDVSGNELLETFSSKHRDEPDKIELPAEKLNEDCLDDKCLSWMDEWLNANQ